MNFKFKSLLQLLAITICLPVQAQETQKSCNIQSFPNVLSGSCASNYVGGLCGGGYYSDVNFSPAFSSIPHVVVSASNISNQGGCIGGATDQFAAFPSGTTTNSTRAWAWGSPINGSCTPYDGYTTAGSAHVLAVDSLRGCGATSQHSITTTNCVGTYVGGLCYGGYYQQIKLNETFPRAPEVLVVPELISDQGGCVGYATDHLACYPEAPKIENNQTIVNVRCNGSPVNGSCGDYNGYSSVGRAGLIAMLDTPSCHVESRHLLEPNICTGSNYNGVCYGGVWTRRVNFKRPFNEPPHVTVAAEYSTGTPCAGGATDKVNTYVVSVDKNGATFASNGSPIGTSCGDWLEGSNSKMFFGFIAIDKNCKAARCSDGIDNDGDSLVDASDPGCLNTPPGGGTPVYDPYDDQETHFIPKCNNKVDDDNDGKIDYPADPGCTGPDDNDEFNTYVCSDGLDNDGDGKTDYPADPGCISATDNDEFNTYACSDGIDNDNDGKVDYPADPGCNSANDNDEFNTYVCSDGLDNDGDGRIDYPADPGCSSATDNDEFNTYACSDGIDNDYDGKVDYPADPGCTNGNDDNEYNTPLPQPSPTPMPTPYRPQCNDRIDNDGDGRIDMADRGCRSRHDNYEGDDRYVPPKKIIPKKVVKPKVVVVKPKKAPAPKGKSQPKTTTKGKK